MLTLSCGPSLPLQKTAFALGLTGAAIGAAASYSDNEMIRRAGPEAPGLRFATHTGGSPCSAPASAATPARPLVAGRIKQLFRRILSSGPPRLPPALSPPILPQPPPPQ